MSWWHYNRYGEDDEDEWEEDEEPEETEPPTDAVVISGPIYATSKRGSIGTEWWSREWVSAFERMGDDSRLDRGRRYARNGAVREMTISYGRVSARVQGARPRPYRTQVTLQVFSDKDWARVLAALAEQAIYGAKLLAGEMPADIDTLFKNLGLSLFPGSRAELRFECSCPDWGDPCKHAAAVYYLVGEQLDADPFILFHLRGRNREQVLATLRAYRGVAVAEAGPDRAGALPPAAAPLGADLEAFWGGGELNLIRTTPAIPEGYPLLRKLGDPPGGVGRELRSIYQFISHQAHRWLWGDENGEADMRQS